MCTHTHTHRVCNISLFRLGLSKHNVFDLSVNFSLFSKQLLCVGMHPNFLPVGLTSACVVAVYIPPSAVAEAACETIHSTVSKLQTLHPNAFTTITADFNHVTLDKTLTFYLFVNCPTRGNRSICICISAFAVTFKQLQCFKQALDHQWPWRLSSTRTRRLSGQEIRRKGGGYSTAWRQSWGGQWLLQGLTEAQLQQNNRRGVFCWLRGGK